jgi:hypothetical protein
MKKSFLLLVLISIFAVISFTACRQRETAPPLSATEILALGEKYLLELNFEQAIVHFANLIEIEPKNPRAYTGLAEAHLGVGDVASAIAALEQGLLELPGNVEIQTLLDELLPLEEVVSVHVPEPEPADDPAPEPTEPEPATEPIDEPITVAQTPTPTETTPEEAAVTQPEPIAIPEPESTPITTPAPEPIPTPTPQPAPTPTPTPPVGPVLTYTVSGTNVTITACHRDATSEQVNTELIAIANRGLQVTQIGNSAFSRVTNLTTITLPTSLESIGSNAFYSSGLTSITLPQGLRTIGMSAFSGTRLTSVTIPASLERVPGTIDIALNGPFRQIPTLTTVTFADGMTTIPANILGSAASVTTVNIPSSVTAIGTNAFRGCTSLSEASKQAILNIDPNARFD